MKTGVFTLVMEVSALVISKMVPLNFCDSSSTTDFCFCFVACSVSTSLSYVRIPLTLHISRFVEIFFNCNEDDSWAIFCPKKSLQARCVMCTYIVVEEVLKHWLESVSSSAGDTEVVECLLRILYWNKR